MTRRSKGPVRQARRRRLFAALLLAVVPALEGEPQDLSAPPFGDDRQIGDGLPFDPPEFDWLDPRTRKAMACLEAASDRAEQALFGARALIALPHAGVLCRLNRQAEVLVGVAPETAPRPPDVPDRPPSGDLSTVRRQIADRTAAAQAFLRHLETLHSQIGRLDRGLAASDVLTAKWRNLEAEPPVRLEMLTLGYRMGREPACQEPGSQPPADDRHADLAFLPELDEVVRTVNLSSGRLVPLGVTTCERGAVQKQCAGTSPVDWTAPCWNAEEPEEGADWPCLGEQPAVHLAVGIGSRCPGDYESQYSPYFTAPAALPRGQRLHVPRPRIAREASWESLLAAVELWRSEAAGGRDRFLAGFLADRADLEAPFDLLARHLDEEETSLEAERQRLEEERQALQALEREVSGLRQEIQELQHEEARRVQEIARIDRWLERLPDRRTAADLEVERARAEAERARTDLDAIRIDCGDRPPADCADDDARLEHDRRRYEAYERLAAARDLLLAAHELRMGLLDEAIRETTARMDHVQTYVEATRRRVVGERRLALRTTELAERTAAYERDEAIHASVRAGHESDQALRREIEAFLAATPPLPSSAAGRDPARLGS